MKKEINLKTWLIPRLRRLSFQWPPAAEAMRLARVARGKYRCAKCKNIFGPKEVQRDHIIPVIPIKNLNNDDFILQIGKIVTAMFPPVSGYQILCISCHNNKTLDENEKRKKS